MLNRGSFRIESPAARLIGRPRKRMISAREVSQGRLQGTVLRGVGDLVGHLLTPALTVQLPRHRGAIPGARLGSRSSTIADEEAKLRSGQDTKRQGHDAGLVHIPGSSGAVDRPVGKDLYRGRTRNDKHPPILPKNPPQDLPLAT